MARKRANLSDLINDITFRALYDKYKMVSVNAFEWSGLPEGMEERHIEKLLFSFGKAGFFRAEKMGFMCLQCDDTGKVNVYGEPTEYRVTGFNYHKTLADKDIVVIENNKLRLATKPFILFYVNKLTEAERTMDVNIKSCKTPVIFACDDKDVLSFKRIFQQVDGNVPAIFADRGLNLESIQSYQTGVTFLGKELMDYSNCVENKLLTFLGLNNSPIDKKERSVVDEVNANNELIQSFGDLQLEARQRACKELNARFGLNISVKRRIVENPVDTVEKEETDVSV